MRRWIATAMPAALAVWMLVVAAPAASAAETDRISSLGIPLTDVLMIGGTVAPGPAGTPVLWSVTSGNPAHLNAVDPATGEALARLDLPGANGAWAVDNSPDGSVYVGTYGDGRLYRWTRQAGVIELGRPIASENFIWSVSTDENGILYGGTYPGGKVFAYDPATGQVRDYGQVVPGRAYIRSIAASGGKVYAGTEPSGQLVELDPVTGATRLLPTPPGVDPTGKWVYDLDAAGGYLYARYGDAFPGLLGVYDIGAGQWVDLIQQAHGLNITPADEQGNVYFVKSGELVRYNPANRSVSGTGVPFVGRVANTRGIGYAELNLPDYPGRSVVGLLWRGMMFRYNPTTGARSFVQTTVRGEPIDITALSAGPDGRTYVGGFLNGGFAAIDPETGGREEFHTFSQSEGMTLHKGRLYIGAYPDARVYTYDPSKPWNSTEYSPSPEPGPAPNPERLFDLKADKQIRPRALVSAGDYLAVGTMPDLGELGGVLAVWDPASGTLVTKQRHVVTDQSIVTLAYRDGIVYGGTSIYSGQSATPPTQPEAKVFAWSVAEQRKLWEIVPAAGKPTVSGLTFDGHGQLWGIAGAEVFAIDVTQQTVTTRLTYGSSSSGLGRIEFNPIDGMLYGVLAGNEVYRLDPATNQKYVLRSGTAAHLAVHPNGDVYFSAGSELFRYDLPEGPCPHPDPSATVTIRNMDSEVTNRDTGDGCTIDDLIHDEAAWPNRGTLVAHTVSVVNRLRDAGILTDGERERIVTAAAGADM